MTFVIYNKNQLPGKQHGKWGEGHTKYNCKKFCLIKVNKHKITFHLTISTNANSGEKQFLGNGIHSSKIHRP